jgi:hypothetical protein
MDGRDLSRRKLLWAAGTVGAAASLGSATAALVHDSETISKSVTAGVLDLETEPSWGNDSTTDPFGGGTASEGDSGRETISLSVSDNPSYLWFRTRCVQCDPVEEALYVRFGVDTDDDGVVDRWLTDDYLSLRDAREQYGEGAMIGEIDATETWTFVVDWEVRESVRDDSDVEFDFEFYAAQSRHVMNTDSVAPDWRCPRGCGEPGGGPDPSASAISWVAFCSSEEFSTGSVEFARSDDGRTLTLEAVPSGVDTILLKYGTSLDVFEYDGQTSLTVGDGTTYAQEGNSFPGTDPTRSNSNPCPESYGCKYEFPDDDGTGGWECEDNRDSESTDGTQGGPGNRSIESGSIEFTSTGGEA